MGRYSTIQTNITARGRRFKETTKYPDIPLSYNDIYVYTDEGDRFDILAQSYYKDPSLWWIISIANPQLTQMSMFPPLGVQIIIPTNIGGIISQFERFNA